MRDRLVIVLLVPVLIFPLVVIAAGGDLDLIWQECKSFSHAPLVVAVYAGQASPTVTASPSVTIGPSPGVTLTPGPGAPIAPAPLLARWAMISASIVLALVALWAMNRRITEDGPRH